MILNNKKAFTMIEMMVVLGLIAIIIGTLSVSVGAAQERARVHKATSEVKIISQAILGYENYSRGGEYRLQPTSGDVDADAANLSFLIGKGGASDSGAKIPVLLQAALDGGGVMRDPWGTPYKFVIKDGGASVKFESASGTLKTGYMLPNFFRLSEEERR